ncbi:hypothetical protein OXPF_40680 [Oxobacter pfennigii]|uniref:Probable zinc-binding domain-containing protein n=1 Tax=Oxobacter pfennigii TaxID=36849 RepID=A0A0P8Y752_9CLOT|nr:hypothetical protein OXPF_40680 [Oxobacter pfennigii]
MADKTIICKDCGKEFVFTEGEQQFYAEKGFANEPTRCKDCRAAKKARFNNDEGDNRRPKTNSFNSPRVSKY